MPMAPGGFDQDTQPSAMAEEWLTSSAPLRYNARASCSAASSLTAHAASALSTHTALPLIRPIALKAWADATPGRKTITHHR